MHDAKYWIEKLDLQPHPEGGYFRETYRAELMLGKSVLPSRFGGDRKASTGIFFLLHGDDFSAFHRIASDEMWHFYTGNSLAVYVIEPEGRSREILLGPDPDGGETFQAVVPAGCWFGSTVTQRNSFALVGCTVAPGFDFADFEMANRGALQAEFPQHAKLIERLTRA